MCFLMGCSPSCKGKIFDMKFYGGFGEGKKLEIWMERCPDASSGLQATPQYLQMTIKLDNEVYKPNLIPLNELLKMAGYQILEDKVPENPKLFENFYYTNQRIEKK